MTRTADLAALGAVVIVLIVIFMVARFARGRKASGRGANEGYFGRRRTHDGPDDYYYDRPSNPDDAAPAAGAMTDGEQVLLVPRVDPWRSWCWCECPAGNVDPSATSYGSAGTTGKICRCPCV